MIALEHSIVYESSLSDEQLRPDGFAEPYRTEVCWPVFLTGARSADPA